MSSANQHHSPFSNGTTGKRFSFCADLINDDHLRHMVLYCLNHHFMLQRWLRYLHSTCTSNSRVRNISISSNFIARINYHLKTHFTITKSLLKAETFMAKKQNCKKKKKKPTTLFWNSSDKTRAISRKTVVFPTPGLWI